MDKAKFGFKDIDKSEKPDKVNNIFSFRIRSIRFNE
jgi:hypothetical protein